MLIKNILQKVLNEFDKFTYEISINKSEFIHTFIFHFHESTKDFQMNLDFDNLLNDEIIRFNTNLEKHFFCAIVKSIGILIKDRKGFD